MNRPMSLRRTRRTLLALAAVTLFAGPACGDDTPAPAPDGDALADVDDSDVVTPHDVADADATDVADDALADDAADTTPPGPTRAWTHRAIGGMSMGAAALTIALERPGTFDFVGALGGYADTTYMMAQMLRLHFAGFCALEDLEARPDDLDDPDADPPVLCGPAPARFDLEVPQDFNRLAWDTNGVTMTRAFYGEIIDNFSAAYGNLAVPAHADSPLIPAGVDLAWWNATGPGARCADPVPVDPRYAFNAEYNPTGAHAVIPLCDIATGAAAGLLPSWFDVDAPRDRPIAALLAVDINGNGRRDLGEPLLLNPWERFDDVGVDGCPNPREDGLGGCLAEVSPAFVAGEDPNGDDYHWRDTPDGTEGNERYDLGEPFADLGLDGVDADVSGFSDHGEDNGVWDAVPALATLLDHDADTLLRAADAEDLDGMDFWFDAGIRDVLHAGVATRNLVAALTSRGREVRVYRDFTGNPDALAPDVADAGGLIGSIFERDLSAEAIGRDLYIEYGDPDASAEAIEEGDGKHVGTPLDAVNRLAAFLVMALWRAPDPDLTPAALPTPVSLTSHFHSPALGGRRGYTIGLPPGYDAPENADLRYPTIYFLHGLGQDASDLGPATIATALLMSEGRVPKAIMVFPDGGCCFVDTETGQRECACGLRVDGVRACVDPTCAGPAESCEVRDIPDARLVRECHRASLYADMQANRWGEPRDDLGYKTSVHELVEHVDRTYRTRAGADE